MTYDVGSKVCEEEGCEASFKAHAWGSIKAEGWFQQKSGVVWCPAHVPAWVESWRAKRAAGVPPEPWRRGAST